MFRCSIGRDGLKAVPYDPGYVAWHVVSDGTVRRARPSGRAEPNVADVSLLHRTGRPQGRPLRYGASGRAEPNAADVSLFNRTGRPEGRPLRSGGTSRGTSCRTEQYVERYVGHGPPGLPNQTPRRFRFLIAARGAEG